MSIDLSYLKRRKYLSPSALQTWKKSTEAFFLKYLSHEKAPEMPQTEPMGVGSAFDAFVKNYIHESIYGENHKDAAQFDLKTIFEKQVDPPNRDFCWEAGKQCFNDYICTGALKSLMVMLDGAESIRMEFDVQLAVGDAENPVVILGKPDLCFTTKGGVDVTFDWKVNGFCSKSGASPVQGYVDLLNIEGRKTGAHKNCCHWMEGDVPINSEPNLELYKPDWALQLSSYSWASGQAVGNEFVAAVDQLACHPTKGLRVAQHRCNISREFQMASYDAYQKCWDIIQSDHIFRDLSPQDSADRCAILYKKAQAYAGEGKNADWLRSQTQKRRNFGG